MTGGGEGWGVKKRLPGRLSPDAGLTRLGRGEEPIAGDLASVIAEAIIRGDHHPAADPGLQFDAANRLITIRGEDDVGPGEQWAHVIRVIEGTHVIRHRRPSESTPDRSVLLSEADSQREMLHAGQDATRSGQAVDHGFPGVQISHRPQCHEQATVTVMRGTDSRYGDRKAGGSILSDLASRPMPEVAGRRSLPRPMVRLSR